MTLWDNGNMLNIPPSTPKVGVAEENVSTTIDSEEFPSRVAPSEDVKTTHTPPTPHKKMGKE